MSSHKDREIFRITRKQSECDKESTEVTQTKYPFNRYYVRFLWIFLTDKHTDTHSSAQILSVLAHEYFCMSAYVQAYLQKYNSSQVDNT